MPTETMIAVDRFHNYVDELKQQDEAFFPELQVFKELGLYHPTKADSWLYRLGNNEEIAQIILDSLADNGRYPTGAVEAAAGQVRYKIAKRKREIEDIRAIHRGMKIFTKGIALLGVWGETGSLKDYTVSLVLTFGFWGLLDQTLAYPDEQILAQGTLIAVALQRAFLLPDERQPIKVDNIVSLMVGHRGVTPDNLNRAQEWETRFNEVMDRGVSVKKIYDTVKKRRYQWPTKGSVARAKQAVVDNIVKELSLLEGSETPQTELQKETEVIIRSREIRKRLAMSK